MAKKVVFAEGDAVTISGKVVSVNEDGDNVEVNVQIIDNDGNELHIVTLKPAELTKA